MGKGVGKRLLHALMDRARQKGAERMVIESDPYAEPFYLHMGATRIGERAVPVIPGRILPLLAISLRRNPAG